MIRFLSIFIILMFGLQLTQIYPQNSLSGLGFQNESKHLATSSIYESTYSIVDSNEENDDFEDPLFFLKEICILNLHSGFQFKQALVYINHYHHQLGNELLKPPTLS